MPPKNKQRNAPNAHDKRHEGGLAAPGKRVSKRGSNGNLNGQANGKPVQSVAPPPLPTTGLNQGFTFSHSKETPLEPATQTTAKDYVGPLEGAARDRTGSETSTGDVGTYGDMADGAHETPHTESHAATRTSCSTTQHSGGTFASLSTILSYYPLRDAISILILLLALPPPFVLVVQALFTSLTFVPPTSALLSISSLPNIKEMFNASNLGNPALFTIAVVDVLFYLAFLLVWRPLQSVFLDLSQAVIAVSLSGAAAADGGPTYSIATCSLIVCVVHVLRYQAIHLTALDYLRSVIHKLDIPIDAPSSLVSSSFIFQPPRDYGWLHSFFRGALGIHIVSQGVTTCIRRSLAHANEKGSSVPAIIKSDPEAAAGTDQPPRFGTTIPEGGQHPATAPSVDGRAPGLPPSARENKIRESSTKRKRKQANQVRSQQPLWAAIASTKVTFVKEMEQRDAADDAKEAAFMDSNTNTNTDTSFASSTNNNTGRIWICEIRDTEILCTVELSSEAADESVERMEEGMGISAGIDKSKPFFVRVNGAAWSSVRIMSSEDDDGGDGVKGLGYGRYDAEIFGLAPQASYLCEVVGIATQRVVCSASLITQPAPTDDQTTFVPSQAQHQALRPSSPITTLKQSIQSADTKSSEIRNKAKKTKKDLKAANAEIKKEIAALKSKLESSGGMDDKHRSRLTQIRQHKNQAEEAADDVKDQIVALGEVPADDVIEAEAKRKAWQAAKDSRAAALRDFDNAKAEAEREMSHLRSELVAAESKREKLAARFAQRTKELEKVKSDQEEKMSAIQKHAFERARRMEARENEEKQLRHHIMTMDVESQSLQQKGLEAWQQITTLQNWSAHSSGFPAYSSPPTPESTFATAATNGALGAQMQNGYTHFGSHGYSPFSTAHPSVASTAPRGRSSSMLSQYSGFTEDGDPYMFDPPKQHSWPMQPSLSTGPATFDAAERNHSEGSGSGTASGSASGATGSTASSSPRPDARTFIPTKMSPIGPPSKNSDKTPQSPGLASRGVVGSSS